MLKWGLIFLSITLSTSVWASKSQEQLLKEFNKAYIEIHKELLNKNLLERLEIQNTKIGEFSGNPFAQDVLRQLIASDQAVAGQHVEAIKNYAFKGKNTEDISIDLTTNAPIDAVSYLINNAQVEQIIMINEAHHIAQHRVLTRLLLEGLWQKGFRYFAVEALAESGENYIHEGYTTAESGTYIEEPIYANLVILAKEIGFQIVSYDYGDRSSRQNREQQAADNLVAKIFAKDKDAKVLIHCGYSHIKERDGWLADVLEQKTGINPLTVNQTHILEHAIASHELPVYEKALSAIDVNKPVIFKSENGVWSAKPGDYDVNVIWPRTTFVNNRPSWATLDRKSLKVNPVYCDGQVPCLIEVYDNEQENVLPSDRMVLTSDNQESAVFLGDTSIFLKATSLTGSKIIPLD